MGGFDVAGWLALSLMLLGLWLREARTLRDSTDFLMLALWSFAAAVSLTGFIYALRTP
jgi:hypothetical protein